MTDATELPTVVTAADVEGAKRSWTGNALVRMATMANLLVAYLRLPAAQPGGRKCSQWFRDGAPSATIVVEFGSELRNVE